MIKEDAMRQFHGRPILMFWQKLREKYLDINDGYFSWSNGLYSQENIFIRRIPNLNAFTINLPIFKLNVWGRLREQEKRTPSIVHPDIYIKPGPLTPYVTQPLSCGLDNSFYLWVPPPPNHCPVDWTIAFIYEYLCISRYVKYWEAMEFLTFNGILHVLDFYVWKHVQYHTTYQVTIVTQFPYIVRLINVYSNLIA